MNRIEYLLTCLSEECAEVAQRASKAARFGLEEVQPGQEETNQQRLKGELNDLLATAHRLFDEAGVEEPGVIGAWFDAEAFERKLKRLDKYMGYSRALGCLTDQGSQ